MYLYVRTHSARAELAGYSAIVLIIVMCIALRMNCDQCLPRTLRKEVPVHYQNSLILTMNSLVAGLNTWFHIIAVGKTKIDYTAIIIIEYKRNHLSEMLMW